MMKPLHLCHLVVNLLLIQHIYAISIVKTIEPSCKVETSDGVVDFTSIAKTTAAAFQISAEFGQVFWNPCNDITLNNPGGGSCTAELLLAPAVNPDCISLGTKAQSKFDIDSASGQLKLLYTDLAEGMATVMLKCDNSQSPGQFSSGGEGAAYVYTGESACPIKPESAAGQKISIGSILIILAISLILVYVIAGIIILKFVKKREGHDIIPNKAFWGDFPALVKDGVVFVFTGGKGGISQPVYDNI